MEGEPAARWGVDWATGDMVPPQLRHTLTGHIREVWAVVDGRPVAITGSDDATVRVWDLATGEQVATSLPFPLLVQAVAVAPGGELLVGFEKELACLSPADRTDHAGPARTDAAVPYGTVTAAMTVWHRTACVTGGSETADPAACGAPAEADDKATMPNPPGRTHTPALDRRDPSPRISR
ncbi:WD40 repeat domain-containing protein [Streptomyces sp. NPDC001732]